MAGVMWWTTRAFSTPGMMLGTWPSGVIKAWRGRMQVRVWPKSGVIRGRVAGFGPDFAARWEFSDRPTRPAPRSRRRQRGKCAQDRAIADGDKADRGIRWRGAGGHRAAPCPHRNPRRDRP